MSEVGQPESQFWHRCGRVELQDMPLSGLAKMKFLQISCKGFTHKKEPGGPGSSRRKQSYAANYEE